MPDEHTPPVDPPELLPEPPPELELLEVGEPLDEELQPIGSERSAAAPMDAAKRYGFIWFGGSSVRIAHGIWRVDPFASERHRLRRLPR